MDGQAPAGGPLAGDRGWGSAPARVLDDDFDLDAHFARLAREAGAGRAHVPLAAFGQDGAADALPPGPVLATLTAQATASAGSLTDDELVGVLQAARRLANLADYQQTVVIAEFARRRQAQFEAAKAAGVPVGCRSGEFPGEELAMELVTTRGDAGARIDAAVELTTRLPRTLAAMAAGAIDLARASTIAFHARALTDADAACADEVLAAAAPGKRLDQLAAKAARLELKLAPEAVAARKAIARQDRRVEARREQSGNASLSGRELDTADVIASKAYIDTIALQLRDAGIDGTLGQLRALALTDLTQGRDPLDRIMRWRAVTPEADPAGTDPVSDQADRTSDAAEPSADAHGPVPSPAGDSSPGTGQAHPGERAPLPALINLLVPAAALLGWGTAPGEAAGWGLLDTEETRALVKAASRHPRTRWCVTVTGADGTAIAHGCAAGQHPWPENVPPPTGSPPDARSEPGSPSARSPDARHGTEDTPAAEHAAQLVDLFQRLNVTLEPVARDTCDHRAAENRYVPGRKLRHLVRTRNQLCTAPACNAQALYCDLDHTVPYPDGLTDQCNLNPKCRRHHRTKQAPGWKVTQPTPGTAAWTTPSGRTHTTKPTAYDL
jgi:hypothetical protein